MGTPQTAPKKRLDGLSRKVKEEGFFSELDKEKKTFSGFWIFVIILLILVFSTLVFGAVKMRRVKITSKVENNLDGTETFADRVSIVKGYGISSMGFSDQEFVKITGADGSDFPLKDSRYEISKDNLMLRGKLKGSLLPLDLKIKLLPAIKDGRFSFLIAPNSIENIAIYGQPKEKIEQIINDSINNVLADNDLKAYAVELSENKIELKVIKEKE